MLFSLLVASIIVLGLIVYYIYYFAPRINPFNKADNFLAQNMIEEAILEFKKILEDDPSNYVVNYRLGKLYFKQDNIDLGIRHFEKVIEVDKYNFEVDKVDVLRMLARAYNSSGDYEDAFRHYFDIVNTLPNDSEALYHVSFMLLGQESFETAITYFEKLVKISEKSFEIFFGAGMASLQSKKIVESINYFENALSTDQESEIGNLAISFAFLKKREFKKAIKYVQAVIDNTNDENASFISKRLLGYLSVQTNKFKDGIKLFEELLEFTDANNLENEKLVLLYDLGMSLIIAKKNELAYESLNRLYELDKNYKNIQRLITLLRKDMDDDSKKKIDMAFETIEEHVNDWQKDVFPDNFIWKICGLKSKKEFDLKNILVKTKIKTDRIKGRDIADSRAGGSSSDKLDSFYNVDLENFRIISNRIVSKLGYSIDEILNTYKDSDGVDFLAHSINDNNKVLVWVRRWKDTVVGEIPLRNFAQAINDIKANEGLFITSCDLNSSAEKSLKRLSKVKVIYPEKLSELLSGFV